MNSWAFFFSGLTLSYRWSYPRAGIVQLSTARPCSQLQFLRCSLNALVFGLWLGDSEDLQLMARKNSFLLGIKLSLIDDALFLELFECRQIRRHAADAVGRCRGRSGVAVVAA